MKDQAQGSGRSYSVAALASAYGIRSTTNEHGTPRDVPEDVLIAALEAIGVHANTPEAVRVETRALADAQWRRMLPQVLVVGSDGLETWVIVAENDQPEVWLEDLTGRWLTSLTIDPARRDARFVDTRTLTRYELEVPGGLEPGFYVLRARSNGDQSRSTVIVTPSSTPTVRPGLGVAYHPHSVTSAQSWGIGEYTDIGDIGYVLARACGVDYLEVSALSPVGPLSSLDPMPGHAAVNFDPNFPATVRYLDPVNIRVEDIPEIGYVTSADRSLIEWAKEPLEGRNTQGSVIERRAVWRAKESALRVIFGTERSYARETQFRAFKASRGEDLVKFSSWWLGLTGSEQGSSGEIEFASWLQWIAHEQLSAAHARMRDGAARDTRSSASCTGGPIGLVRRIPLGCRHGGYDAASLGNAVVNKAKVENWNELAADVGTTHVAFMPLLQQWRQVAHLKALVDSVRGTCARVVLTQGDLLFTQKWLCGPIGRKRAVDVTMDHTPLLAALATAGHLYGIEIAFDALGLEPWMREEIDAYGLPIIDAVDPFDTEPRELWHTTVTGSTLRTLGDVPIPGMLSGEDVELSHQFVKNVMGKRRESLPDVRTRRAGVVSRLVSEGLADPTSSDRELADSLYASLSGKLTPWLTIQLADGVGETRPASIAGAPGYPHYRIKLRDSAGGEVRVENVVENARLRNVLAHVAALREDRFAI